MTERMLEEGSEIVELIEKFKATKQNNFQIKIDTWDGEGIVDKDFRPEAQARLKQLFIDEMKYLEDKFENM